jgi:uncharacterized protein (TIGR03382 family)
VLLDLRTVQQNDGVWRQHSLSGIAPAGAVGVLVTAYAVDMVPNVNTPPGGQSAFFDDFALTVIPEPGTITLAGLALVGAALTLRRRR